MITKSQKTDAQQRAAQMMRSAGIQLSDSEIDKIEVVDFGLSQYEKEGAAILTLVQTGRIAVKLLALFPNQTEPEHWHPSIGSDPGKEETVRAVWGDLRFYIPGENTLTEGFIPEGKEDFYTCRNELILNPSDQLTLEPGKKHWFQAGPQGAVLYSFSTIARDVLDKFTDPNIKRITEVIED